MNYLLDTHTFLWFISDSPELSEIAKKTIEDENNSIFLSIASLWEISIKTAIGRLVINGDYASVIDDVIENQINILPINFSHTLQQNRLSFFHRDPFDRIIVSQAIVEKMELISVDVIFDRYFENTTLKRLW